MEDTKLQSNYSVLAHVYDRVMEEIDYEAWADFIDEIMQTHHPDPIRILELGCGTGILTLSLDELMCYSIIGTDKSPEMISKAREKAEGMMTSDVTFKVADFMDLSEFESDSFDVALLTFDSINYLHHEEEILQLLKQVKQVLADGGIFIFDFTTPHNSVDAIDTLDGEEGFDGNYYYYRESEYDSDNRIHTNIFTIRRYDDQHLNVLDEFREVHEQRIYTLDEMLRIVQKSSFHVISKYGDFDLEEADQDSLRVTMTLQCPQTP